MKPYGYKDEALHDNRPKWHFGRWLALILALAFICTVWFALNQKLLFGDEWMSQTYDHEGWKTNEGDQHTFGAWDLEAHIWKTEFILKYWPNFNWNPYWYLGMPLLKYYQSGFYVMHALVYFVTGASLAKSATLLIISSHLLATLMTFLLCYKVSRRIWVSALCSIFTLANTFITLRSYGWEPITVVFLWLFPLGLLVFLRDPLRPFRFWMLVVMVLAYLSHPLLFFSLCMTMGLYLFSIAIKKTHRHKEAGKINYIWHYFGLVFASILVGAVQFFPQGSYHQVTSGAHMGVKYLPFYQVPFNIITLKDFLFDAGNLKGPGPIIMIAFFLIIIFMLLEWLRREPIKGLSLRQNEMIWGLTFVLVMMIIFYYIEAYNIFPMNYLRSIQYHRIIPEFVTVAAVLVAALSNVAHTFRRKALYYTMLITFVLASFIIIYNVQDQWQTTDKINDRPEFLYDDFEGRFTNPYPQQSLSVRNSFTEKPQVYGYYEQGVTNSYTDEIFSVSSGFHNAQLTILYLQATNVERLYINNEEGQRDAITKARLNTTLEFKEGESERYSFFEIPIKDTDYAQTVPKSQTEYVKSLHMGCREMFKDDYCGSEGEEFVSTDEAEIEYLQAYVDMLEADYEPQADYVMINPDNYGIYVVGATEDTQIVFKMTHDKDFHAYVDGEEILIEEFGPDFMLLSPNKAGEYNIHVQYQVPNEIRFGAIVSIASFLLFAMYFFIRRGRRGRLFPYPRGDMK